MLNEKELSTYEKMKRFGGSFIKALAECWLHADAINKKKLEESFPSYFQKYGEDKNDVTSIGF